MIEVLDQAGFADAEHRLDAFPHQLSGGQRQRVMIAMALANDPALLIADEPTTALDVTIQAQILQAAGAAAGRSARLALLLITHDLQIVRRYADRVCVMKDGAIVEAGRVAEVFAAPAHPYTRMLLGRGAARASRRRCRTMREPLLQADDVKVHFAIRRGVLRRTVGHVRAVDGVSRHGARRRDGRTGRRIRFRQDHDGASPRCGWSTRTGRITFDGAGHRHARPARAATAARAACRSCSRTRSAACRRACRSATSSPRGLRVHEPAAQPRPSATAASPRNWRRSDCPPTPPERYPHEFSGGQRQRIAIARAMVLKPRFVVLDEPTSALDMSVQAQIVDLLRRLQQTHGLAYLFISHDLKVVRALAHRVVVLRHGRVVEEGDADSVFAHPREDYTRALMAAAFTLEDHVTEDHEALGKSMWSGR